MQASAHASTADPLDGALPARPAIFGPNDWTFVTPKDSKGWILDAICREIGSRQSGSWDVVYNPKVLPEAGTYFFSHYWNYIDHLNRNPHIEAGRTLVWYTHPREIPYSIEEQVDAYNRATQVVFTCTEYRDLWIGRGVRPERGVVVLGGADPDLFVGHSRGSGCVGLSSSYYERKNPDALIDVVRTLPHRRFKLIGRNWHQYERFDELLALPNFEHVQAPYSEYPAHYATFDVFLSLAMLEGGPIPVLEAMTENVVPVASRTGFCPDLIAHGENGFLFDVGAPATRIAPLIEAAFDLKGDIRRSVKAYSWDHFANHIHHLGRDRTGVSPASAPSFEPELAADADQGPAIASGADIDRMERIERVRVFVEAEAQACGEGLKRLSDALRRPSKPDDRPVLIQISAGGPDDVLATPAASQIAAIDGIAPFLVIVASSPAARRMLETWAVETGLDGLVQIEHLEDAEAACMGSPSMFRVIARCGPPLGPAVLRDLEKRLKAPSPTMGGSASFGPTGVFGGPVAELHDPLSSMPGKAEAGETALRVDGDEILIVPAPPGGVLVCTEAGNGRTVVTRRLPRAGAPELRFRVPLSQIRNRPYPLYLETPGSALAEPRSVETVVAPADLTPRMLRVCLNRGGAGNPVMRAFADGLSCPLAYADDHSVNQGVPVVWGVLRGSDEVVARARAEDRPFFYIDHAYFGRGHYLNYRITRNAYEAGRVRVCPPDRAEQLGIELTPWRADGGNIVVCPPTQYFMDAHGCPNWLDDTLSALYRATDRPVEVRDKPAAGEPSEPLSNVFLRAHAIVTHSSNVAVEAVVAGVPVFVSPSSAAAPVGETDLARIEKPSRPDRKPWLSHLAYSQFTLDEIADGSAWRILMQNEQREFAS